MYVNMNCYSIACIYYLFKIVHFYAENSHGSTTSIPSSVELQHQI